MTNMLASRIEQLLTEGQRLSEKPLYIVTKTRFIDLVYDENNRVYIYARVEGSTGDIYVKSGKKVQGNIFEAPYYGINIIGKYGVIVNAQKYQQRQEQLILNNI